jgi:hypothetical protein
MADGYDPYAWYNEHVQALLNPGQPTERVRPQGGLFPPLEPEDQQSFLSKIGHGVLGGIGYIGSLLDKYTGGRAIRGLLGGKPEEALSVLPFSDVLGITNPEQAVSGSELLGQKPETFWEHLPGMGVEMLLNPFTFMSGPGGAFTPLGRAAQKAGVLPRGIRAGMAGLEAASPEAATLAGAVGKTAAEVAGQPLRGLSTFGIPFLAPEMGTLGTGAVGQKVADVFGKYIGDPIRWSRPGRELASLFKGELRSVKSKEGQEAMMRVADVLPGMKAAERDKVYQWMQRVRDAGEPDLLTGNGEYLTHLLEGSPPAPPGSTRPAFPTAPGHVTNQVVSEMRSWLDQMGPEANEMGKLFTRRPSYAPHVQTPLEGETAGLGGGGRRDVLDPMNQSDVKRMEAHDDLPKDWLNQIYKDKDFRALPEQEQAAYLRNNYLQPWYQHMGRDFGDAAKAVAQAGDPALNARLSAAEANVLAMRQARNRFNRDYQAGIPIHPDDVTAAEQALATAHDTLGEARQAAAQPMKDYKSNLARAMDQSEQLALQVRESNPGYAELGKDYFGQHGMLDLMTRGERHAESMAKLNGLHDLLARQAKDPALAGKGEELVNLYDTMAGAGKTFSDLPNAVKQQMQRLEEAGKITPGSADEFMRMQIPASTAKDLGRAIQGFGSPEATRGLLAAFDSVTNISKFYQAVTWPARYARNYLQQLWGMFVGGHTEPGLMGPMALAKPQLDALKVLGGGTVQDLDKIAGYAGKPAEKASADMSRELLAQLGDRLTTRGATHELATLGPGEPRGLNVPGTPIQPFTPLGPTTWDPRDVRGFGGRQETTFLPGVIGEKADQWIDKATVGGSYVALRRQGYSPAAAAAEVKKIHYDYGNLSDFERKVMRRALPFYSWMRQNIPAQLEQILAQPGGKTAAAIRAAGAMRGQGFMPDEIAQSLAMPLGKTDEKGNQRYLTGLGLPFEDAFNFLQGGRRPEQNIAASAQEMLSQLNPMAKLPLELATGTQLRTGRQLADLYEPTGFLPKNTLADEVLMNSPVSRFFTTGRRMFFDPRKDWLDALMTISSPLKKTDVDMPTRQAIMEREYITDMLRGQPGVRTFERPVVQPTMENLQQITPETALYMRALARLEKEGREEAKRKQVEQPQGAK